jgi:hypothetical protein
MDLWQEKENAKKERLTWELNQKKKYPPLHA